MRDDAEVKRQHALTGVTPPVAETNVTSAGSVSVTVTGPDGELVPVFVTVMV